MRSISETLTFVRGVLVFLLATICLGVSCRSGQPPSSSNTSTNAGSGYEVVNVFPHDPGAYTQGLEIHDGKLLESTGEVGHSSLRWVELATGNVVQRVTVPPPYFAEGLTLLNGKIYQITWQHQTGFIYDATSLNKVGEFKYYGEGWGLTNAEGLLILSDGTNRIRFMDPETFQVKRTINVLDKSEPVRMLNELEYVNGEILANVWHDDRIARIDPQSGQVRGWINLKGIIAPNELSDPEAVLNGIAYDQQNKRLFVTGKMWPKLFEIRIK